jgi:hypothetical protein
LPAPVPGPAPSLLSCPHNQRVTVYMWMPGLGRSRQDVTVEGVFRARGATSFFRVFRSGETITFEFSVNNTHTPKCFFLFFCKGRNQRNKLPQFSMNNTLTKKKKKIQKEIEETKFFVCFLYWEKSEKYLTVITYNYEFSHMQ